MKRWYKCFHLILFIFFFACATAPNTHVASHQDEIPKEKPYVEEVAAVEVTVENSMKAPSDKSPKETSNSKISSTPSREQPPDIKIMDASAGAKDEEALLVEKSNGDKKQNLLDTALDFYQASQELWSRGEMEGAIDALDEAYSLILKVNSDSNPAMIQEKEDLRILISRR